MLLCCLLLFYNMPQSSIEPVDFLGRGSLEAVRGRGPKEALAFNQDVGVELSKMVTLLHSAMFVDQGIKLKWIRERMLR